MKKWSIHFLNCVKRILGVLTYFPKMKYRYQFGEILPGLFHGTLRWIWLVNCSECHNWTWFSMPMDAQCEFYFRTYHRSKALAPNLIFRLAYSHFLISQNTRRHMIPWQSIHRSTNRLIWSFEYYRFRNNRNRMGI